VGIIAKIICGILALNLYGMSAYVSEVDHAEDMVEFTDYMTESQWWIEGDSDKYAEFEDVVLIMHDCGTESRYDDIVIKVTPEKFGVGLYVTKGAE
jgi:hypothetical protein